MTQALAASCLILAGLSSPDRLPGSQDGDAGRAAEARAVEFLKREVPAWSKNNGCFSCHNNGDAARALYRASQKGYRLSPEVLTDTSAWLPNERPILWLSAGGTKGLGYGQLNSLSIQPKP